MQKIAIKTPTVIKSLAECHEQNVPNSENALEDLTRWYENVLNLTPKERYLLIKDLYALLGEINGK